MVESILYPVLVVSVIGLLAGLLLSLVSYFIETDNNEMVTDIVDILPGANCAACGYAGCEDYAKAIVESSAETNLCVPGGNNVAEQISDLMGTEFDELDDNVAYVKCNGKIDNSREKLIYRGVNSCKGASMMFGGKDNCIYACEGFGDCISACAYDAITINDGIAVIDINRCTGCGQCVVKCPKELIQLTLRDDKALMLCSNTEKGNVTRKICSEGCIACGLCVKSCNYDAIKVENNMAVVDESKCTACGSCVEVCPVKVLKCI